MKTNVKGVGATLLLVAFFLLGSCESDTTYMSPGEGGKGGSMARFTVAGDYLYTIDDRTLRTFDISNESKPHYLKTKNKEVGDNMETIFARDTLLFLGSRSGMYIYNIARPEFPSFIACAEHFTSCDPVVATDHYAYVTLNSNSWQCGRGADLLDIYDLHDISKPEHVFRSMDFNHPRGLGIDGNKLFICDNTLKVYDISNPVLPVWIDDTSHLPEAEEMDAYDVIPMNGLLLLIGETGLYQFDYRGEKLAFVSKITVKPTL